MIEKETYKIWVDDTNYIRVELLKNQTENDLQEFREDALKIAEQVQGEKDVLFNVDGASTVSAEARKMYVEIAKMEIWHRIAIFGGGVAGRVLTKFIIAAIGLDKVKLFKTEEEALKWLKE